MYCTYVFVCVVSNVLCAHIRRCSTNVSVDCCVCVCAAWVTWHVACVYYTLHSIQCDLSMAQAHSSHVLTLYILYAHACVSSLIPSYLSTVSHPHREVDQLMITDSTFDPHKLTQGNVWLQLQTHLVSSCPRHIYTCLYAIGIVFLYYSVMYCTVYKHQCMFPLYCVCDVCVVGVLWFVPYCP